MKTNNFFLRSLQISGTLHETDRVESGQLAAQVDDEDDGDGPLVPALLEELVDGDAGLAVRRLLLHLVQLGERLVRASSQPQQGCGGFESTSFRLV